MTVFQSYNEIPKQRKYIGIVINIYKLPLSDLKGWLVLATVVVMPAVTLK